VSTIFVHFLPTRFNVPEMQNKYLHGRRVGEVHGVPAGRRDEIFQAFQSAGGGVWDCFCGRFLALKSTCCDPVPVCRFLVNFSVEEKFLFMDSPLLILYNILY
jgi:hypothetical protein